MKLVKVRPDLLINPENIEAIEMLQLQSHKQLAISMQSGRQISVTVPTEELLKELIAVGMDPHDQFFAG